MLVVSAMSKWQLALSQRPGPKRLPRVSSFSYYIPKVHLRGVVGVGRIRMVRGMRWACGLTAAALGRGGRGMADWAARWPGPGNAPTTYLSKPGGCGCGGRVGWKRGAG
jgi:hypothetical protein